MANGSIESEKGKAITIKDAVIQLEEARNSTVISYVSAQGQIITPDDCMPLLENLESLKPASGKINKLDLFLHSPGGLLDAAYKYVRVCKEYSNEFNVIVPLFAKSAATALCLGANEIIMTPISELGPLDPIVQHPYKPNVRVPARAIQDYFDFLKRVTTETSTVIDAEAKNFLNQNLDPYLIGSYENALKSSEQIATILLKENALAGKTEKEIETVVNHFTKEFHSHGFVIDRAMAKKWGLKIINADDKLLKTINQLFAFYSGFMQQNNIAKLQGTRDINRHMIPIVKPIPKQAQTINLNEY
jgi:membrane-bound ClpP family serine protease